MRDRQRDDLEVLRLAEHSKRFSAADPFLFPCALEPDEVHAADAADDDDHQQRAQGEQDCADQYQLPAADLLREECGQTGARRASGGGAAADESKQPLGGARVVDQVGQRPELADEQHRVDLPEQVERDIDPILAGCQHDPEEEQQPDHSRLSERNDPAARQFASELAVALHDQPDDECRNQQDVRQVFRAERADEPRARNRLHDVVGSHREKRVAEHHQRARDFFASQLDDRRQELLQQRHDSL